MGDRALGNHQGGATCFTTLWLCGWGGLREGTVLLPGFWGFARHSPHFQSLHSLPIATGALPPIVLELNPRVGGFAYILRLYGPFKLKFPENPAVSSATPTHTGFYSQKSWGFIFPSLKPWTMLSGLELGWLASMVFVLIFIYHRWMWDFPCLLDFHTVLFSDSSGCHLFLRFNCNSFCGCARRKSMSTYNSILTTNPGYLLFKKYFIYLFLKRG